MSEKEEYYEYCLNVDQQFWLGESLDGWLTSIKKYNKNLLELTYELWEQEKTSSSSQE